MKVLQVKKYNKTQEKRYHEDCRSWKPQKGGFPQAAFYFFSTNFGSFRKTGYVAFNEGSSFWRPTKKEAVEAFGDFRYV
jgi:hypothetical protein